MRRVRRVLTDVPRTPIGIARATGSKASQIGGTLKNLIKAGLAMKVQGGYVRSGTVLPVLPDDAAPIAIGRQILLCLTEPRRARDIARIINRPPSNATGQLAHLLRRGLVVRVAKGVYDIAGQKPVRKSRAKSGGSRPGAQHHGVATATGAATQIVRGV